MRIGHKIKFQLLKAARMSWYNARYRIHPWKTIEGVQIPVLLSYGYSVLRFIDNGEYEQHEIAIIKDSLEPGDTVLELGTGIGFVSAVCAAKIGGERVHTFEGNPAMKPLIDKLYTKNKVEPNATIALLGNTEGESLFYRDENSFLASTAIGDQEPGSKEVVVPRLGLNATIKGIRPSFLVMDIEGGEYEIFKIIDFQTICKVQFEMHPTMLSAEQMDFIFNRLEEAGFKQSPEFSFENNFLYTKERD